MNPATNDTQKLKKPGQTNSKEWNSSSDDRGNAEKENSTRGANFSSSGSGASQKSEGSQKSSAEGGSVTALRDKSEDAGAGQEKSESKKDMALTERLDLALVDASISLGDIVKKIDAFAPKEGAVSRACHYSVEKLSAVQNYLGETSTKEIASKAWAAVRKSPWPVGLAVVGAGVGYYIQKKSSGAKTEEKAEPSKAMH